MENIVNPLETPSAPVVKTGDWVLTVLISNLPLIGLIMLIVWAVDKEGNPNKANWAKAMLIWYAIAIAIAVIFVLLVGVGVMSGVFGEIPWDEF